MTSLTAAPPGVVRGILSLPLPLINLQEPITQLPINELADCAIIAYVTKPS